METTRGRVASAWRKDGGALHLQVAIPANSSALVYLPAPEGDIAENGAVVWREGFREGVPGITSATIEGDRVVLEIGSGSYAFEIH